jgi:hypothetical protein
MKSKVSLRKKVKKYKDYLYGIPGSLAKKQYIFILSHKRSRTTLLSHILGSHPEICGYRELHVAYRSPIDIFKARVALFEDRESFFQCRYLLDKILHNEWQFNEDLFCSENVKFIFIMREPERCMLSMIKRHLENNSKETVFLQSDYYINRLHELEKYWLQVKGEKIFIDSDDLIINNKNVLSKLTGFLGLDQTLSKEYSIFEGTGKSGIGDMSQNIKHGQLIESIPDLGLDDYNLLDLVDLDKLKTVYAESKKLILS